MFKMRTTVLLLIFGIIFIAIVKANPAISSNDNTVPSINRNQLEEGFLRKLNAKCSQRDNHSCTMLKLIVYMNRLFKKSAIDVGDNLKITKMKDSNIPNDTDDDELFSRSMDNDDEAVGVLLAEKIWSFVRSREMRYRLADNADFVLSSEPQGNVNFGLSISPQGAVEEGRGKMKNMGPLVALMAAKMGMIGALFIKGLVLLTGKALIVSKIALLLAVIIGLKKLLSKKHVTYEVVQHPHHHEQPHHDSYSAGWSRALDGFLDGIADMPAKYLDPHELAFKEQKPINES